MAKAKRVEESSAASNCLETLDRLFNSLECGAAVRGAKGETLFANKAFRRLCGAKAGEKAPLKALAAKCPRPAKAAKELSTLAKGAGATLTLELKSGRFLKLASAPLAKGSSSKLLTVEDVTRELKAERKAAELGSELTRRIDEHNASLEAESRRSRRLESIVREIDERERERLGRDIHDMVGQTLTALAIRCEVLKNKLVLEGSQHSLDASSLLDTIKLLMDQTRSLARQLFPVAVESREIDGPLSELANSMKVSLGVDCSCDFRGERHFGKLDSESKINIFRIAQEAVSNAIKHAKARKISISLELDGRKGSISIRNDGLSFPEGPHSGDGIGMSIMKSRAEMLGGTLSISKPAQGGAKVRCDFPLRQRKIK